MLRVLVVDDSASVRSLLTTRMRESGYDVQEAVDGESGLELALASPPDVVVTDLVMTGISGVQLCRLLRTDPVTAHVPIVLLTASGDKRSRFWARSAGAAAYVSKDRLEELVTLLPTLIADPQAPARPGDGEQGRRPRTVRERISSALDSALFDSVMAGEVRALGSSGDVGKLFGGLATLLSDIMSYRWLALSLDRPYAPLLIHAHPEDREAIPAEARSALGLPADWPVQFVADGRAVAGAAGKPESSIVVFGGKPIGGVAMAPTARGLGREEQRIVSLVVGELGGPLQMTALYEDARRLASTDALTGLLNRRALLDALERERARSERHKYPFSLLLLDIDHFKLVNDTHGHAAGDAVLAGVARALETVARRSDFVARWGGEEFVVALPQTSEAGARVAAERVRRGIAQGTYAIGGGELLRVTASIGVASAEARWKPDAVLAAADAAMYSAKANGRNRAECLQVCDEIPTMKRPRPPEVRPSGPPVEAR
jgi:two-component system, cell cycle response regulator